MTDPIVPPVPRVSVLMTTYNGARFIAESIDSVLGQTFADFELVVVDDASTDATASILARYRDPRLRIVHNPTNLGVVGARNRGFATLRGAYVAVIDHDDLWRPTRLAAGVALLDSDPAITLAATQCLDLVKGRLSVTDHPVAASPLVFRWMLLFDCPVTYSSLLFRRAAATLTDGTLMRPELCYADDYELIVRLAAAGKAVTLHEPLTIYREHGGNTTRQVGEEMYRSAVLVVTEQLAPWFEGDRGRAAQTLVRYIGRRTPVPDRATLARIGGLLRQLLGAFIAHHHPDPADCAAIESYAQQIYWRMLRNGIRSGHVWLLSAACRGIPGLAFRLDNTTDLAGSLALGILRMPARLLRSSGTRPPSAGHGASHA